nr:hypothetical protein [Mycobacterium leprae]
MAASLSERLPQHKFIELTYQGHGDAPLPLLFVVSAVAELAESDCVLLRMTDDGPDFR